MLHRRGLQLNAFASALLVASPLLWAQPIGFVRESLQLKLADDSFAFSGIYYFDNPGQAPVEKLVYFPYVLSGDLPDSTKIIEVRSGRTVPNVPGESGFSFMATVRPQSTQSYRVSFIQRARTQSLEYIFKTTSAWGRPLDRATITIRVPMKIALKSLSIKPDSVSSAAGATTYMIDRKQFMPDRNLILKWRRERP